jgi:putative protein-disulfide isomerase
MNKTEEIIFVADPMCSWCWGFEPVMSSLVANLPDTIKVSLLLGGLRAEGDQEWDDEFKEFLRHHWKNVQERTGQSFNLALLEKEDFDYNTEPSCRAVVTMRELDKTKQFTFFKALQEAFYLRGEDITQDEVIVKIAEDEGVDKEAFLRTFLSAGMKEKTKTDIYKSRSMGANVFPSVVIIDDEGHLCVVKGYKDYEEIKKLL